jgi:molybdopterin-guanine dinucleotide biosynthesis protein MobB
MAAGVMPDQIVVGFLATSGTGKTSLLERLIPLLAGRGHRVGLIKHCSREFEIDHPGKDTWRLKRAGARRVAINNDHVLGLVADLPGMPSLEELVRRHFAECDVVLVEGHRTADIPKIIVERRDAPRGLISPEGLEGVIAVVSDLAEDRFPGRPRFAFEDLEALAEFILRGIPGRSGTVAGVVLAGGLSRRLGTDKAQVTHEGATLLERASHLLAKVCRELWVVGRRVPENLEGLGVRWHLDLVPRVGPLGGLYTALKVADAPRCLLLACDMPCVNEEALRRLLAAPSEAPAVVARGLEGRSEPLAAIYSQALLPKIEALLAEGDYKLSRLFDQQTHYVDFADEGCFFNVNTPQEWARLKA